LVRPRKEKTSPLGRPEAQLALAVAEEDEDVEGDAALVDALLLAAAFSLPDDLASLELLLSELSDLAAGVLALLPLSSELLAEPEPGLP
jgi:hypothetical protein